MADPRHADDLTTLRAEFDAFRARVERRERRHRLPRRLLPLALAALLVALVPLAGLAAGPTFSDIGTAAAVHQPNIQAIGDAGITTGFEDPAHPGQRLYNPKDTVTREEMASFLARTAGLGGNPPVANAKTAQTAQAAQTAQTATDASTVGGIAPNGLARTARVARTTALSLTQLPTEQTYLVVTLVAPAPGFVVLTGAVTIRNGGDVMVIDEHPFGMARLRLVHLEDGGADSPPTNALFVFRTGATATAPVAATFPVQAGTQTFQVRVALANDADIESFRACYDTPCVVSAVGGSLSALFVPFGYDGGTKLAP